MAARRETELLANKQIQLLSIEHLRKQRHENVNKGLP